MTAGIGQADPRLAVARWNSRQPGGEKCSTFSTSHLLIWSSTMIAAARPSPIRGAGDAVARRRISPQGSGIHRIPVGHGIGIARREVRIAFVGADFGGILPGPGALAALGRPGTTAMSATSSRRKAPSGAAPSIRKAWLVIAISARKSSTPSGASALIAAR